MGPLDRFYPVLPRGAQPCRAAFGFRFFLREKRGSHLIRDVSQAVTYGKSKG